MAITEQDINNLHRLEDYLKSPRNVGEIANYLGVRSHHSVDKYVNGLDRLNGKYYFIPDVAESMLRLGGVK